MIEPGDIVVWPPGTRVSPDVPRKFHFGHAEIGCDMIVEPSGDANGQGAANYVRASNYHYPNQKNPITTFWPFGVNLNDWIPNDCLVFRSVANAVSRRMIMELGFAATGGVLNRLDGPGRMDRLRVGGGEIKPSEARANFPKFAGTVQAIFLSSKASKANVTHALRTRYLPRAQRVVENYDDYLNQIHQFDANGIGEWHELGDYRNQIIRETYCSQFIVIACQLAAVTAVKRVQPDIDQDTLIDEAMQHPLWVNLRPKTTWPSHLLAYLRTAPNWQLLGKYGDVKEGKNRDVLGLIPLRLAVTEAFRHYDKNLRSRLRITSSTESKRARVALQRIAADETDVSGSCLTYAIALLLGVKIKKEFIKKEKEEKIMKDLKDVYSITPLKPKSRLYRCLAIAVAQQARDRFELPFAMTKDVSLFSDDADFDAVEVPDE